MYHGKSTKMKESTTTSLPQQKDASTIKDSDDNTKVCKQPRQKGEKYVNIQYIHELNRRCQLTTYTSYQ